MLRGIHEKKYLLPAIQREFVWDADQIRSLVDSLLRGYPIGSFLVWDVKPESASDYVFYDFLTHYHERDNPYAAKPVVPGGSGTLAVLDGQQRLTALNIAFHGSYAVKKKYAWWNSACAFPTRRLHLNLLRDAEPDDLGLQLLAGAQNAEKQACRRWNGSTHVSRTTRPAERSTCSATTSSGCPPPSLVSRPSSTGGARASASGCTRSSESR